MAKTTTPWVDFTACKKIPLIEIFQALGIQHNLTKQSDNWRGVCPLPHGHTHGSKPNARQFVITAKPTGELWLCFGCQRGGDAVSLVRVCLDVDNAGARSWFLTNFGERVTTSRAADETSTNDEPTAQEETVELEPLSFYLDLSAEAAAEYLMSRGITVASAGHFGVGLAKRGLMAGRVCFPIHRPGAVADENPVGYCGRSVSDDLEPKYLFPRDFLKSRIVFGLRQALADSAPFQPWAIVESPFSVLKLYQLGIVALCTFGAQCSDQQAEIISACDHPIWILFDPDEAGTVGAGKAKETLHAHGSLFVAIVELPGQPDALAAETLRECLHL